MVIRKLRISSKRAGKSNENQIVKLFRTLKWDIHHVSCEKTSSDEDDLNSKTIEIKQKDIVVRTHETTVDFDQQKIRKSVSI